MSYDKPEDTTAGKVNSTYLVDRLLLGKDENIFNYVKFRLIAKELNRIIPTKPRILDLGCGDKVACRYLAKLGLDFDYCSVDYEPPFQPDILADLRKPQQIASMLPWQPNVIFLLDVLEHFDGQESDILQILKTCHSLLPSGGHIIVTCPQMYRLDKFKFPHLNYSEHAIRLTQNEWQGLLKTEFKVLKSHGVGFISVIPYLPMFKRNFEQSHFLMNLFKHLREKTVEKKLLRKLDWHLSNRLGKRSFPREWANDVMFVCEVPLENSKLIEKEEL